jgi:hypothetical protein
MRRENRMAVIVNDDGGTGARSSLVLDADHIVRTVARLRDRIGARFPERGLVRLVGDLHDVASTTAARVATIEQPHTTLRVASGILIAAILTLVITVFATSSFPRGSSDAIDLIQTLDSALNDIVLIGAAIFFLVTVEGRIKRRRALRYIRELRALAHIVDMHQVTKDPERLGRDDDDETERDAPPMTAVEMARYLDYCSEMLSIIGKVAALYIQGFDDPVVLSAVDEVESLTTGLSGKIWQKIMILERTL